MTDNESGVDVLGFFEQIAETLPEVKDLVEKIRNGEMTDVEATLALTELVNTTGRREAVAEAAQAYLGLDRALFAGEGAGIGEHLDGEHALYLAEISERVQFDGDVPELRTGPRQEGATPAVRVETDAVSPVALGLMLKKASSEIEQVEREYRQRMFAQAEASTGSTALVRKQAEKALKEGPLVLQTGNPYLQAQEINALLKKQRHTHRIEPEMLPTFDPPEYRRQRMPSPRRVAAPTGAELALLSDKERTESAWAFISSTQGRRSVVPTISARILRRLRKCGCEVIAMAPSRSMKPSASYARATWQASILSEGDSFQSNFSHVDVAAAALAAKLLKALEDMGVPSGVMRLVVSTVDDIPGRSVGWSALLFEEKHDVEDVLAEGRGKSLPSA